MSAAELTSSASPPTYGPFIDSLTESRTLKELYKALDIEAESDKTTAFKESLFDFFRDGRTSFITRLRNPTGKDASQAYEGLGLTIGPNANSQWHSLCAFYLDDAGTPGFAVEPLVNSAQQAGTVFSDMWAGAEEATERVMKDIGNKDGARLFEQGSVEDDHFQLALLALSDSHPRLGTGRAATTVKRDEPGEANSEPRSMSSPLDVAQWLLESGMNLRQYKDVLKTVWTSMVQHRLRSAFNVSSATAVLPSVAVFCSTGKPSQDVAGCLLIGTSAKRNTAGAPNTYTLQWYALKDAKEGAELQEITNTAVYLSAGDRQKMIGDALATMASVEGATQARSDGGRVMG